MEEKTDTSYVFIMRSFSVLSWNDNAYEFLGREPKVDITIPMVDETVIINNIKEIQCTEEMWNNPSIRESLLVRVDGGYNKTIFVNVYGKFVKRTSYSIILEETK